MHPALCCICIQCLDLFLCTVQYFNVFSGRVMLMLMLNSLARVAATRRHAVSAARGMPRLGP